MKESNKFGGDACDSFSALTDEELRRVTGGEDELVSISKTGRTFNMLCKVCGTVTSYHRNPDGKYMCDICGTTIDNP